MANRLQKSKKNIFLKVPILTIVSACVIGMLCMAVLSVEKTNIEEKEKTIEDLVMRSALHCYSIEGVFPNNIEYLIENYNLTVDTEGYIVNYVIPSANEIPEISVTYDTSQEGEV